MTGSQHRNVLSAALTIAKIVGVCRENVGWGRVATTLADAQERLSNVLNETGVKVNTKTRPVDEIIDELVAAIDAEATENARRERLRKLTEAIKGVVLGEG